MKNQKLIIGICAAVAIVAIAAAGIFAFSSNDDPKTHNSDTVSEQNPNAKVTTGSV